MQQAYQACRFHHKPPNISSPQEMGTMWLCCGTVTPCGMLACSGLLAKRWGVEGVKWQLKVLPPGISIGPSRRADTLG